MSRLLKTQGQVLNEPVNSFETGRAGIAERCTKKNTELNLAKLQNQDVVYFTSGA